MEAEERKLGYEIKQLSCLMRHDLDRQLSKCVPGLTSMQARIIGYLSNHTQEPVYQRDLEREFEIRGPSVTSVLQLMEKNGLIVRSHVSHDARLKRLELTPKAVAVNQRIRKGLSEHEKRIREGLTEEEVSAFLSVLSKMKKNLTNA